MDHIWYVLKCLGLGILALNFFMTLYFIIRYLVESHRMEHGKTIEEIWFGKRPRVPEQNRSEQ